jgi:hypothetical protein
MTKIYLFKKMGSSYYYGNLGICVQFVVARMGRAPNSIWLEVSNEEHEGWTEIFLRTTGYAHDHYKWGSSKDRIRGGMYYAVSNAIRNMLSEQQAEQKKTSIWVKLTDFAKNPEQ